MKKLSILTTYMFFTISVIAQWPARYNGAANRADQARLIAIDENNNVYVTGASDGKKGGDWDIATVKYNSSGVQQWVARYNGTGSNNDYPYGMTIKDGFVYVTGRSPGTGTNDDCITLKYAISDGNQEWAARTNGAGFEQGHDVKVDNNGNVFVTGFSGGSSDVGGSVMTTIKYNINGSFIWEDNIPIPGSEYGGNSIVLDGLGNLYVAGAIETSRVVIKYNDIGSTFNKEWQTHFTYNFARKMLADPAGNLIISGWGNNFETLKVDVTGNIIGQYSYPNAGGAWDMKLDGSGNIYLTGIKMSQPDGSNDYSTAKLNSDGSAAWLQYYRTSVGGRDHARSIALDAQGNVFVTGFSELISGRNANTNYATVKYDNSGTQQWAKLYDGPDKSTDNAFGVAVSNSGNAYVTGQSYAKTSSNDYLTLSYAPDPPQITARSKTPDFETSNSIQLINYPNPFNNTTTIEYRIPKDGKVKLTIYDLQGKEIATLTNEIKPAGLYKLNFAAHKFTAGTYLCRIQAGEFVETKKLILAK